MQALEFSNTISLEMFITFCGFLTTPLRPADETEEFLASAQRKHQFHRLVGWVLLENSRNILNLYVVNVRCLQITYDILSSGKG